MLLEKFKSLTLFLRPKTGEKIEILLLFLSLISLLILVLIVVFVIKESIPAFAEIGFLDFIFGQRWAPYYEDYGAFPLIYGSIMIVLGCLLLSVPIGILTAIFLAEYIPRSIEGIIKPIIELLAAIPSVIYGFFGLIFLAPKIAALFDLNIGKTALTASIILSIMVLPTIVSVSSEIIASVPLEFRKASIALGATHWQTIKEVILPVAKPGIMAAILLAFGRAIGETVAVLMVCGCVANIPNPFWNYLEPVHALTAAIALDMGEVAMNSLHYHALFGLGVILFVLTFITNTITDLITRRAPRGALQL